MPLLITDENFQEFMPDSEGFVPASKAGGEIQACGLVPRDYSKTPYGACEFATPFEDTNVPLIPREEWPDRIAEMNKWKSSLLHLWKDWGRDALSQGSLPYCHAFSPAQAMLIMRKQNGLPEIEISAGSIGGPATGYQRRGAWIGSDLRVITQKGAATTEFVPMHQVSRRGWKPGAEENALLHRVTEWWECRRRNLDQHVSCLLQCHPVCVGLNYWSHAVTDLMVRDLNPRMPVTNDSRWGIDFLNSWGPNWGENGIATRTGSKKYADEAYVPRLTLPSNE